MLTHRLSPTPLLCKQGEQQCPSPSIWLTLPYAPPACTHSAPLPPHNPVLEDLVPAGCPLGCSRQTRQEGRVQTSCGWSFQPPPALALAFLQADVDARHCEVVCALVRLNKVPARHATRSGVPQIPQQPQTCQSLCKAGPWPPGSRDLASTNSKVALTKGGNL